MSVVWLVCNVDYDTHEVLAGFSTEEAAKEYQGELYTHPVEGKIIIEKLDLDLPRSELQGAWDVEIALDSDTIVAQGWWLIRPDALLQIQGNERTGPLTRRATGLTREEAVARAKTLVAQPWVPPDNKEGGQ
jgi:hypothetical protein